MDLQKQQIINELNELVMKPGDIRCDLCGKLVGRRNDESGAMTFLFGKSMDENKSGFIPVHIEIIGGTVKMRCIRKRCRKQNPEHWIIINNNILKEGGK